MRVGVTNWPYGGYTICDRCGDPVNYGLDTIVVRRFHHHGGPETIDLCPKCADKWSKMMLKFKKARLEREQRIKEGQT